jgi:hypothetical protein
VSFDAETVTTYSVYRDTLRGPRVMFVGTTRLAAYGSLPVILNSGLLLLLDTSGKIVQAQLDTYGYLTDTPEQEFTLDEASDRLSKAILMKRSSSPSKRRTLVDRRSFFVQIRRCHVLGETTE